MMLLLALLASASPGAPVAEAVHALASGRPAQARAMIARAVAEGATGPEVDRLLADLAMVEGRPAEALARYNALIVASPAPALFEQAGKAALAAGDPREAARLLDKAVAAPQAGWRAWNARAVAADRLGDWTTADRAYEIALDLAPDEATAWNNHGWSLMLRGRWEEALAALTRARALAPAIPRIAANLDLARAATEARLPERRPGESGSAYAARLNDAGVMARLRGDAAAAEAAFAQALEASERWFAPAADNLAELKTQRLAASRGEEGAITKRK